MKSQSCASAAELSNFEWTHYRFEQSKKEIRRTMVFDFCVTRTSNVSSSLSGLALKNSGYVLIMKYWTTSLVQLYSWILVCGVGRLVIFVNISQSILNFWSCYEVISELSFGNFGVGCLM